MSDGWSERNLVRIDALKQQIAFFHERGCACAERNAIERLCFEDLVRAISQLRHTELLDELKTLIRTYDLSIDGRFNVYKLLYPRTYMIVWKWARGIDVFKKEGLRGLIGKIIRKLRVRLSGQ